MIKPRTVLAILLVMHAGLLAWSAYRHSPTADEWGHLPAGLIHWREARFDAYRVNPHLVRMLGAAPLVVFYPELEAFAPLVSQPLDRPEFLAGLDFYLRYGDACFWYFTVARWACIPFSLLGVYLCYRWAMELYGPTAGLVAAALWSFSPSVLAYGQLMVPDVGAASLGLAANYVFWRWLRRPSDASSMLAGTVLATAILAKATWIVLLVLWPVVWLVVRLRTRKAGLSVFRLVAMLLIAVYWLNAAYLFQGTFSRLGDYEFASRVLSGKTDQDPQDSAGNRFRPTPLAAIPVPLPADFVLGIDRQKVDFELGMPSYLRGEWRRGGWWYYYLYAMAIKEPLGTWILFLWAGAIGVRSWMRGQSKPWDEAWLLLPAVVVLTFVSSQTGFNHHLRYVLPAFPYLYIFAARLFQQGSVPVRCAPIRWGLLVWAVASSLWVYPHSLSYFNEAVGGPMKGHLHLHNSNTDWGQDLIFARQWLERHPEIRVDGAAIGLTAPLRFRGEIIRSAPQQPTPGYYVVSVNAMCDYGDPYGYFRDLEPAAMITYAIRLYRIDEEPTDEPP
jgi:4-amino-4-deoxy-L-arabinose transferase-like glycosyltransferase